MHNNILHVTLSANGSPSVVKARIDDQVKAATQPDQSAALAAARIFIEKSIAGVSEDDTLAVNAVITISVIDAPAIEVAAKAALHEAKSAAERIAEGLRSELTKVKDELAKVLAGPAPVSAAPTSPATTPCAVCTAQVISDGQITRNPDGTPHSCPLPV